MNYKLIPLIAVLASCGDSGVNIGSSSKPTYNLPADILQRTLDRSSRDGFSAVEVHTNGDHTYVITVVESLVTVFS